MKHVFLLLLTGCLLCHHVTPGYSAPTIEVKITSLELAGNDQNIITDRAAKKARAEAAERAANYFNDVGFIHLKKEGTADFEVELKLTEKSSKTKLLVYSDATMYYILAAETKKQIVTTNQASEVYINDDINFALNKACILVGRRSAKFLVNQLRDDPDLLNRNYRLVFTGFEDSEEGQIFQAIKELALRDGDIKDDVQGQGINPLAITVIMRIYKKLSEFVADLNILLEAVNIKVAQGSDFDDDTVSLINVAQMDDDAVVD